MVTLPVFEGPGRLLEDHYLANTRLRLRRETGADGIARVWKIARKYGATAPGVEPMTNLYLNPEEHAMLATLPGASVSKRRHDIMVDGVRWVIDLFDGALQGRVIAEVELSDANALWALAPPPWCGREITGDPAYSGATLARAGWPTR